MYVADRKRKKIHYATIIKVKKKKKRGLYS